MSDDPRRDGPVLIELGDETGPSPADVPPVEDTREAPTGEAMQTVAAPVITSLLFLMVFAVAIGERAQLAGNVDFITFLVPGLVMMTVLQNAFANSSSSLVVSDLVLYCLLVSGVILSCRVLSCGVLPCVILSRLGLSCLVLSCLVLPCLVLSFPSLS